MEVTNICVSDVDELCDIVDPWQYRMSQLSLGDFHGEMRVAIVGDLFVSEEYWSRKIVATGQTPPGYVAFGGAVGSQALSWCGDQMNSYRLGFAPNCREIDFLSLDHERHWTLLIPRPVFLAHIGEDTIKELPGCATSLSLDPRIATYLSSTVLHVLRLIESTNYNLGGAAFQALCRERLLAAVTVAVLNACERQVNPAARSTRFLTYRRAQQYMSEHLQPISTEELAAQVGASRRTLELGFKENTGITPQIYMRRMRLNALHRELRCDSPAKHTVTWLAEELGFSELGRVSGYYKELFGELPSDTLRRKFEPPALRFSDVLLSSGDELYSGEPLPSNVSWSIPGSFSDTVLFTDFYI